MIGKTLHLHKCCMIDLEVIEEGLSLNNVIHVKGSRENILKNISVIIPKKKLVVLTGPSGSGKSTLAMDTLFKECQRQYLESKDLHGLNKHKVDSMRGLPP